MMDERHEFIAAEIERAYVNADDDWKKNTTITLLTT